MDGLFRDLLAFMLSAIAGGLVQQGLMIAVLEAHEPTGALVPLLALVLGVSLVFAIVVRRMKTLSGLNRTAAWLIGLFLVTGAAALVLGFQNRSPGIGGNIILGLAILLNVGFLLPGAAAVLIHWWLMRRHWRAPVR